MPITSPGLFAGSISVTSSLQLWGAEANGVMSLVRSGSFEWTGLVGFRYVDLYETLNISSNSADILTDPATVLLQRDQFNTRNQFAGAQLGSRFTWMGDRFGFDVTGKVALGATHQTVEIQGSSTQSGPGGVNGTFPGGFFTQPSNMGSFSANQFAVIPSVELKLYILLSQRMRLFAGYDFMYWSQVVRPGSQIDHNINLSQSAVFGSGTLSGPASPGPLFTRTDFWAQGVSFGLEVRY
jgi:Putative beta barrel porin-7 (BBP7)